MTQIQIYFFKLEFVLRKQFIRDAKKRMVSHRISESSNTCSVGYSHLFPSEIDPFITEFFIIFQPKQKKIIKMKVLFITYLAYQLTFLQPIAATCIMLGLENMQEIVLIILMSQTGIAAGCGNWLDSCWLCANLGDGTIEVSDGTGVIYRIRNYYIWSFIAVLTYTVYYSIL